ncbi:hypothetical protein JJQ72_06510 [Paenibacillus sp. F411]|uniref:hypothetical protein n=1 Tax=Paenibacillus sp. F411 TaxID=2820239 RepID=UPI001AAF7BBA|nr:hypothetical protein [Paenibacillus sp. F411]MBO2943630.1 hypothetical protein [Paenibacillus sp. F411]
MTRFVGIDPATKTGFIARDPDGTLLRAKEITGIKADTPRMVRTLHDEILRHLKPGDVVGIEGFALDAQDTNKVSSGCNWAARMATDRVIGSFVSPRPNQLKKYVNVSEWVGEPGSKKRLKGKAAKQLVIDAVYEHWGYRAASDNIADAYVLSMIAEAVYRVRNGQQLEEYPVYQQEVIMAIIDPDTVKKPKKPKSKTTKRRGKPAAADSHTQNAEQTILF